MKMAQSNSLQVVVVEQQVRFTLIELCQACHAEQSQLVELVELGALEPEGAAPDEWRFGGPALRRARTALSLSRDLDINVAGAALVLDLMDQIAELKSKLLRAGMR
jgi:chaperone modulatory protein CbpM